uniref:iron chelate uptake ABC transporter family permease subunit n=1 Tax=Phaeovulum sp. TaxID=2934796 RepID=UPI0035645515
MSYRAILGVLVALVVALFCASLMIGSSDLGLRESLSALISGEGVAGLVMREIRLPRALLGILVGAALGMAGAAMQGFLRNPLAEPGLIGTSGAAALGAVIAIHTGA